MGMPVFIAQKLLSFVLEKKKNGEHQAPLLVLWRLAGATETLGGDERNPEAQSARIVQKGIFRFALILDIAAVSCQHYLSV